MSQTEKRMLVVVDGSERSLLTIRYLTQVPPFHNMDVTVMHVFGDVPDAFWDLEKEPSSIKFVPQMRAWRHQQIKGITEYMDKCRRMLLEGGFSENKVNIKIHTLKKGVARDIVAEAQKDYDMIVLRRRGLALSNMFLGSVAVKLLERITTIPLILAGRDPVNQRMLIAVDGSEGSMRAVEFVGTMLADFPVEIELLHVIRRQDWFSEKQLQLEELEKDSQDHALTIFNNAIEILTAYGVAPENISTKLTTGVYSRAGAIVTEAREGQFGTIVVGRRGLSKVQEFFMGRVGHKVIQATKNRTIWVVN